MNGGSPPVVQRHSSWEHTLLGDTPPARLGEATVKGKDRGHLLSREWGRLTFLNVATRDPRTKYPEYRWIELKGSELWVTYGELNALADYLPDPSTIDTLPQAQMIPVVQRMRKTMTEAVRGSFGLPGPGYQQGAAESNLDYVPGAGAAAEVSALDSATAGLVGESGVPNRYSGLLARNACHFAPMSWQRWALYHNEATSEAMAYNQETCRETPVRENITAEMDEHKRKAWLNNGYGDHFLQDSFAAGHLVNKTLVMQWFAEYLTTLPVLHPARLGNFGFLPAWALERPSVGVPSGEELEAMSESAQPGLAGRGLYNAPLPTATSSQDRASGTSAIDPQSAQERTTSYGRLSGSGAQATDTAYQGEAYQTSLDMLNSSYLQLAASAAHDWFNERGLSVSNERGDTFTVGGDDTLLDQSSTLGAQVAAEAAQLSQRSIEKRLVDGDESITTDDIFQLLPKYIWVKLGGGPDDWKKMGLEQFQDEVLHELCLTTIFPALVRSAKGDAVRFLSSEMVAGGISADQE